MQANYGQLIKHLRKKRDVTQEELAKKLFISQRTLSNVEKGTAELNLLQFRSAFSILGVVIEDYWIIFLTPEELDVYLQYKKMKSLLGSGGIDELRDIYSDIKHSSLVQKPFLNQFISYIGVITDEIMPDNKKLKNLDTALRKSIRNFEGEKIGEYRLSYSEVLIVGEIALLYARLGKRDNAIQLLDGIVQNIDNTRITNEDKIMLLPKPLTDLATLFMEEGEYEKAAVICEKALEMVRANMNIRFGPVAAYTLGICHHKMGSDNYMHFLAIAYHTARAFAQNDLAEKIRGEYDVL